MAALIPLFRGGWDLPVQKGREPDSKSLWHIRLRFSFGVSLISFFFPLREGSRGWLFRPRTPSDFLNWWTES